MAASTARLGTMTPRPTPRAVPQSHGWWIRFGAAQPAPAKLICFPYAGGQASIFKSWAETLGPEIDVYGIQLPGHGHRRAEPLAPDLPALVGQLGGALHPLLDARTVFFGHSLGALLAFEVARWLRRHREQLPAQLVVSGRRAPQLPSTDAPTWIMSDDQFRQELTDLNGTPPEILDDTDLLELFLPLLRADFKLDDTYVYIEDHPLDCPIVAVAGIDDEESHEGRLEAWQHQTSRGFVHRLFEGDHFFIRSSEALVLDYLRGVLQSAGVSR